VQRWEREEGLPVHRLAHEKRGSIYATTRELAAWWESRRLTLAFRPDAAMRAGCAPSRTSDVDVGPYRWPALSSDARLIAYVSDAGQDGTTPQIWIQQMGGAALRLTTVSVSIRISRSHRKTPESFLLPATIRARMCTRFRRLVVNRGSCNAAPVAAGFRPMVSGS
jgi:hypothetical protein